MPAITRLGGLLMTAAVVVLGLLGLTTPRGQQIGGGIWAAVVGVWEGGKQAASAIAADAGVAGDLGRAIAIGAAVALVALLLGLVAGRGAVIAGVLVATLLFAPTLPNRLSLDAVGLGPARTSAPGSTWT